MRGSIQLILTLIFCAFVSADVIRGFDVSIKRQTSFVDAVRNQDITWQFRN